MGHFLRMLFQLVLSPGRGWEDIAADATPVLTQARRGLFPLLGIAGASVFLQWLYRSGVDFVELLCGAIVVFVQYFISYYVSPIVLGLALAGKTDGALSERHLYLLSLYGTGVMALVSIVSNCVPIELSVIEFLPIFTALVLWKGTPLAAVKGDSVGIYIVVAILTIIVLPLLLGFLLSLAI